MVQVRWLSEARDDLKNIYEFIARDSEKYASRQVSQIFERVNVLKKHPQIGKVVEEINRLEVREISEGNYRIIYRIINGSAIEVLMIHHAARDLSRRKIG